jgi:hypothetical protein
MNEQKKLLNGIVSVHFNVNIYQIVIVVLCFWVWLENWTNNEKASTHITLSDHFGDIVFICNEAKLFRSFTDANVLPAACINGAAIQNGRHQSAYLR